MSASVCVDAGWYLVISVGLCMCMCLLRLHGMVIPWPRERDDDGIDCRHDSSNAGTCVYYMEIEQGK